MKPLSHFKSKSKSRILIFEFITGGGFSQQALPSSLAKEGLLMLEALLAELGGLGNIELTLVLDWRIEHLELPENTSLVIVSKNECIYEVLPELIENVDWVWPVAPEVDAILQKVTALVESKSKQLLNSSSEAVALCSDKFLCSQILEQHAIATVETILLEQFSQTIHKQWVLKPRDGVGCLKCYLISNTQTFTQVANQVDIKSDYIMQPYIEGDSLSLSCLFKDGKAWLLCCNQQVVSIHNGMFQLDACIVNIPLQQASLYQTLIDGIATAIPGLFGYVGIDIIQPEQGPPRVLEINPRLTTSYTGINQATGLNVASAVIAMTEADPVVIKSCEQQVTVTII